MKYNEMKYEMSPKMVNLPFVHFYPFDTVYITIKNKSIKLVVI